MVIATLEVVLFSLALIVFVIFAIMMLRSR